MHIKNYLLFALVFLTGYTVTQAQAPATNYDESKVPPYTLPDPLLTPEGKKVVTTAEWEQNQRPYILKLFTENVYGRIPHKSSGMHFSVTEQGTPVMGGKAVRKQVTIHFEKGDKWPFMDVLIYLPKTNHPVPVFVGLNFNGNHTVAPDKEIRLPQYRAGKNKDADPETLRGTSASRWPVESIVNGGYGVATAWYYDLEPDNKDGWKDGIRTTLKETLHIAPEEWSAIGAWAWGLSRIQDYLETDKDVDAKQTILLGHSRLGKTSLWAGANDGRFSIVISNESGEGGAALSRRIYGETIRNLNTSFPHWFIERYKSFNDHPEKMPTDQHMLLSLIAPRPLYVASAEEDRWADPKGEFLSAKNAGPVYALYKLEGVGVTEMPPVNTPVGKSVRYHVRTGKHDVTLYDWTQYIHFADQYIKK
ncbi:MAG: acetylxylan esterase [Chitinophagaceae bacterium]|nr:acetylxylan esterase [Chitinophagaceae bacterium]